MRARLAIITLLSALVAAGLVAAGLVGAGFVGAGTARAGEPAPAISSKDEAGIKAAIAAFAQAWSANDPKAVAATFTEDAVMFNIAGKVYRGRAEIEADFVGDFIAPPAPLRGTSWEGTATLLRPLAPGVVLVDIDCDVVGKKKADGTPMPMKHHVVSVARRQGDRWLFSDQRPYFFAGGGRPPGGAPPAAAPKK